MVEARGKGAIALKKRRVADCDLAHLERQSALCGYAAAGTARAHASTSGRETSRAARVYSGIERPAPALVAQHMCLYEGYDNPTGQAACDAAGYIAHVRRIGEEKRRRGSRRRRRPQERRI